MPLFAVLGNPDVMNGTEATHWLPDDRLPSNGTEVHVVNGNESREVTLAGKGVAAAKGVAVENKLLKTCDALILSIVCVGLLGNTLAFCALSSRGCRGRRSRWRTHHALAILLQVNARYTAVKFGSKDVGALVNASSERSSSSYLFANVQ